MSEAKTAQPKVKYTVEGDSPIKGIFREANGEKVQVAKYDSQSGIVEVAADHSKLKNRISMYLNDQNMKFVEFAKIGAELMPANAPKRPPINPRLGTKTPAVVEWYATHNREVFISKYGVKELLVRTGFERVVSEIRAESGHKVEHVEEIPIYEPVDHLEYEVSKLKSGEHRLLADSKTHLTEKMKDDENDPDRDWGLDD